MVLHWLRNRRRRSLAEAPFAAAWAAILRRSVRQYEWLDDADRERLHAFVAIWLDEKRFEGCRGMEVTDEVRVSIAGQAAIVALGLGGECFDRLKSVLIYPDDYAAEKTVPIAGGGELVMREERLGETWAGGSMVFSWPRVVEGGRMRDGPRSVVVHECAHAFDLLDGDIDGVPPIGPTSRRRTWVASFEACNDRFLEALDAGRSVVLDDYASEGLSEFFAVASEAFFQSPHRLARFDEELYDLLAEAWRQDPRGRVPISAGRAT